MSKHFENTTVVIEAIKKLNKEGKQEKWCDSK